MRPQRARPLAIVALLLAFVVPFVAVPLGHVLMRSVPPVGHHTRRIAQATIIAGYLMTLLLSLIGLNLVVALVFHSA
ncbi:hypothetical protein [Leifsonia sp. NPDC077715]|uniref:hypothetical protein n=1 Tax=Leifsonia sp. NPDC077715 TaxID=3155539 RepID=UPI00343870F2